MSTYSQYYDVVRRIPRGRVATYGQVARLAGFPGHARQVGYAMSALPDDGDVPWHRVINARGEVSRRSGNPTFERIQRTLLEAEGIVFDRRNRVDLHRYGWSPRDARTHSRIDPAGQPVPDILTSKVYFGYVSWRKNLQ